MPERITGIINPIVMPFTEDGAPDVDLLHTFAEDSVTAGCSALFIMGSAGQGPTLTYEERRQTADRLIKHMKGKIPIFVHVGTTDLRSTAQLAVAAKESGADGIGVIPPYYYSDHPPAEIDLHFKGVAKTCDLPMWVYNNEQYSGINITPPWLARLANEIPTITGVKLAYASLGQIAAYLRVAPERVSMYAGTTLDLIPMAQFGVKGSINPPSTLFPELSVAMWNAIQASDWNRAHELFGILLPANTTVTRLGFTYGRSVLREGLRMRGYPVKNYPRWETADLPDEAREELKKALQPAWNFEKVAPAKVA